MAQVSGAREYGIVPSTKKSKIGSESWEAQAASVWETLQNQQLHRNSASRSYLSNHASKIVSHSSNRTSAWGARKSLQDEICWEGKTDSKPVGVTRSVMW